MKYKGIIMLLVTINNQSAKKMKIRNENTFLPKTQIHKIFRLNLSYPFQTSIKKVAYLCGRNRGWISYLVFFFFKISMWFLLETKIIQLNYATCISSNRLLTSCVFF